MKYHASGLFLILVLLLRESSCSGGRQDFLLPLTPGSGWIYRDSIFKDQNLVMVRTDTLRVESSGAYEGTATAILSDGRELMVRNDTLFQLVSQRSGYRFPTPLLVATDTETTLLFAYGGDVVMERKVVRMKECPVGIWKSAACYRLSDACNGEIVFGMGVGILKHRAGECFSGPNTYTIKTLIGLLGR